MKTWENATLVELEISATAEGGCNREVVDHVYTDKITGHTYMSCASGGNAGGDEIIVIK